MQNFARPLEDGVPVRRFYVKGLRWWIAILLMGVTVINYLDRSCLSVAAPVLKKQMALNEVDYSHIIIAFQLTYLVMQPVAGRILDWIEIRAGLAISLLWWSVAQMLTGLATGWRSFAALRALLGIGEAASFPGAAKAVSQWFRPSERTVATGILNVGAGLGSLIAPPLCVYLILRFSWQTAFVVTGALGLGFVALWAALYRAPENHPWLSPEELAHVREGQAQLAATEPASVDASAEPTISVLRDKNFWAIAIARFLSEPAWQFFTYWIPLYFVTERHLNLKAIAYFGSVPFLAGDVGCIFGGVLSPLFIRAGSSVMTARKLSATVCGVLMMCAALIGRAPNAEWAVFYFCVGAFAHQAMSSTLLTLPADLFPKRSVGTAFGLAGMIGGFGGMLFTAVVGEVAMRVGYSPLFLAMSVFDLVGAALLWMLLRDPGRRAAER